MASPALLRMLDQRIAAERGPRSEFVGYTEFFRPTGESAAAAPETASRSREFQQRRKAELQDRLALIAARLDQKLQRGFAIPDWDAVERGEQIAASRSIPQEYQKQLEWGAGVWRREDLDQEELQLLEELQRRAELERTR